MHDYEVELQGSFGFCAFVRVTADTVGRAEFIASRRFPELTVTGNTRDLGPAK